MYNIGYYNKPWSKSDFVILAQTKSNGVAHFIMDSYNVAYKRNGMSANAIVLRDDQLPEDHRFSKDCLED